MSVVQQQLSCLVLSLSHREQRGKIINIDLSKNVMPHPEVISESTLFLFSLSNISLTKRSNHSFVCLLLVVQSWTDYQVGVSKSVRFLWPDFREKLDEKNLGQTGLN